MKNYVLLYTLAAAFAISSCSKNDEKTPEPVTAEPVDPDNDPAAIKVSSELLTGHEWKLTGLTQSTPGQAIFNDIFNNSFPACQRDDVYTFEAAKTVKVEVGFVSCSASEQLKTGTWNLKNAKNLTLTIPGLGQAGLTGEFSISQLDQAKLVLKQTLNGSEFTATYEKYLAPTKTQLLTASPWNLVSIILQTPGSPTTDITPTAACEKDNVTEFFTDGTFETTEGPTKCHTNDPNLVTSGNWSFLNGETKMIYEGDEFEIKTLTPTKMVLEYNDAGVIATHSFSK